LREINGRHRDGGHLPLNTRDSALRFAVRSNAMNPISGPAR